MNKKAYITPDTRIVVIPLVTLLITSTTDVPYNSEGITEEALSPLQELDIDPNVEKILF